MTLAFDVMLAELDIVWLLTVAISVTKRLDGDLPAWRASRPDPVVAMRVT